MQAELQAVLGQLLDQHLLLPLERELALHALEAGLGGTLKAVQEIDLGEQHAQIRAELRNKSSPLSKVDFP
jgi:hypothetical protein